MQIIRKIFVLFYFFFFHANYVQVGNGFAFYEISYNYW